MTDEQLTPEQIRALETATYESEKADFAATLFARGNPGRLTARNTGDDEKEAQARELFDALGIGVRARYHDDGSVTEDHALRPSSEEK